MTNKNEAPKQIKKLTIDITDQDALGKAFPEVMKEVTEIRVDREKLYPIVKAMHSIGREVPGVHAFYAAETAQGAPETGQGAAEGSQDGGEAVGTVSGRSKAKGAA